MRKALVLLLALGLIALFASCSQDDSNPVEPTVSPAETAALQYISDNMDNLQLRAGVDGCTVRRVQVDRYGLIHVRMNQSYRGLRVRNGSLIVHMDADLNLESFTDGLIVGVEAQTRPQIGGEQAKALTVDAFLTDGFTDYEVSNPELMVMRTDSDGDRLAWETSINSQTNYDSREYFIDAENGSVLYWYSNLIQ